MELVLERLSSSSHYELLISKLLLSALTFYLIELVEDLTLPGLKENDPLAGLPAEISIDFLPDAKEDEEEGGRSD